MELNTNSDPLLVYKGEGEMYGSQNASAVQGKAKKEESSVARAI